jgi:hydrogenase expression/formation protein HypC
MCLAIPTLIKSIDGESAQVQIGGVERSISLVFTPEAKVGDYVIVHTGFALSVLDEEEAQETLRMFAEIETLAEEEQRS